jgi:hypothetical protein
MIKHLLLLALINPFNLFSQSIERSVIGSSGAIATNSATGCPNKSVHIDEQAINTCTTLPTWDVI